MKQPDDPTIRARSVWACVHRSETSASAVCRQIMLRKLGVGLIGERLECAGRTFAGGMNREPVRQECWAAPRSATEPYRPSR